MEMMKKVAIIGADDRGRIVLTRALSYITGYDIAGKTDYAIQAIRYGLNKELKDCPWQELFVYVLSGFSERIIIEQQYGRFISNGSVLLELAMAQAILKTQTVGKRQLKEQSVMLAGTEKVIKEYAQRQYDCLVLIENGFDKDDVFSHELDLCIKNLLIDRDLVYRVRQDSILADLLENMSSELRISPVLSPQTALKKAQDEISTEYIHF
jgi:hypothetical protein